MKTKLFFIVVFLSLFTSQVFSQSGWNQLNSGVTSDLESVYFFDAQTGLAAGQSGVILRTTNGGLNWSSITSGTTAVINEITFPSPTTGYFIHSGYIRKSTNSGLNWSLAFTFVQSVGTMYFVDENNGHVGGIWAGYPEGWWLKTTNGGTNFTGASLCQQSITSIAFPSLLIGYVGTSTNFVGYPIIRKTTNSGVTWTTMSIGITNTVVINTLCFLDEYTGWAGVSDGRIYKTVNGGTNWTYLTLTGQSINKIQFKNMFTGYLATGSGSYGSIYRTRDGGNNWEQSILTSGGVFNEVYFINILTGFAVGDNGKIFKTTVGGENVPVNPKNLNVNAISSSKIVLNWEDKSTNETGFKIFRSTDAGASWILKDSTGQNVQDYLDTGLVANHEYFYRICAYNIVGNSFYSQIDWDTTYPGNPTVVKLDYSKITIDKQILSNQSVYDTNIVTLPYASPPSVRDVEISIDTMIGSNIGAMDFVLIHQGIFDTVIYKVGGTGSNFIRTVLDDSATVPIANGTPPFTGRFRPSKPLSQFSGLDPRGLWLLRIYSSAKALTGVIKSWGITITYNTPSIGIKQISSEVPDKFELQQNYPNPFNSSTNIKFKVINYEYVKLSVYDILGREIQILADEKTKPGEYLIPFDCNRLASGIYYYKLTAGDFTDIKRMVLLK